MNHSSVKRGIDILGASTGLALTLPVTLATAAILFAQNRGDIFFTQKRIGKDGKEFDILKFRTMTNACDDNGVLLPNHQRVTSFGRFLRKHSIDEIPQFLNVLKGDMSLVGPRPLRPELLNTTEAMAQKISWLSKYTETRQKVRPGLVSHFVLTNSETSTDWTKRLSFDAQYARHACFCFDAKLMARAAKAVVTGRENTSNNCNKSFYIENFLQEVTAANPRYGAQAVIQ